MRWLITGSSRGLGRALAAAVAARGDVVLGPTRAALDVTNAGSVTAAVDAAFAARVDVVVNCAGVGVMASIEEASDAEIARAFDVNFHGTRRVIQAALPHLRAQRGGHIVNVTSMAAVSPNPGTGYYAAAKAAVSAMSLALAKEVAPLGIRVTVVEPSAFRTDFLTARDLHPCAIADYASTVGASFARLAAMTGREPGDPARAAAAILRAVAAPVPPLQLVLGSNGLARARAMVEARAAELAAWEADSVGADY